MRLALLSLGLLSCAKVTTATPPPNRLAVIEVISVTGLGSDRAESQFTLQTKPTQPGLWAIATTRTQGRWTRNGITQRFDSDNVLMGDPWHHQLQHEISATPAIIWMDANGRPERMFEEETWRSHARGRVLDLQLPAEALRVGENLLDPVGLVSDLARYFPGTPTLEQPWRRMDRLSGMPVIREEQCQSLESGKQRSWRCEGTFSPTSDARAEVHEGTSWTQLAIDRRGLVRLEEGFSGTMVVATEDGFKDRPIAGQRLVTRR
ncbi:MAG: hypothetical protein GWP91_21430 [Rhodobacterales bacterium]|nr:hypothetical protein [Rhodobacterales bacterium]